MPAPSPLRRTPGPRVSACALAIPAPPEPWVADARRAAARLHTMPALVAVPEADGVHRPRGTWRAVALAAVLAGAAVFAWIAS